MDDKVHTKCEQQLLDISVLWLNLNPVSDNRQFLHLIRKLRIARITEFLLLTEALLENYFSAYFSGWKV